MNIKCSQVNMVMVCQKDRMPMTKVATFEIQRFKISVSCFSSTCRYNTVHVPCGIAIQTSPVGLPLDGWGARMRDNYYDGCNWLFVFGMRELVGSFLVI
jgi:predicted RNA-binding Zn ribbon-like protein